MLVLGINKGLLVIEFLVILVSYSRVSNKRVGWNKRAGWKIPPNFGNFGDLKVFEIHLYAISDDKMRQ